MAGDVPGKTKKVETQKNVEFAQGGDTPMFGHGDRTTTADSDAAGEAKPAVTGKATTGGGGDKYAEGGSEKMFGYHPSVKATAGITGPR